MTLSDPERRDARGQFFLEDLHNYTRVIDIGVIKQVREKHVSRGRQTKEAEPHLPQKFWTLYPRPNGLTYSDEISYDNTCEGLACF